MADGESRGARAASADGSAAVWTRRRGTWELDVRGRTVATCHDGSHLAGSDAPRPYLHPVRTLDGHEVTAAAPADHPHHHGLSLAVSSVNGVNLWGGRTYVRGVGSTMLANHGVQRIVDARAEGGRLRLAIAWEDAAGALLLEETRVLTASVGRERWSLAWSSELTAALDLTFESSATKGRAGAGYGGIFWRFPPLAGPPLIESATGRGEANVHGSTTPWLRLAAPDVAWSVTLQQHEPLLPWFVRGTGYAGAGPSVAFDTPRSLGREDVLTLGLTAELADHDPDH